MHWRRNWRGRCLTRRYGCVFGSAWWSRSKGPLPSEAGRMEQAGLVKQKGKQRTEAKGCITLELRELVLQLGLQAL